MVFFSTTDLICDDSIELRPGSPLYLGSTSSSGCSSPKACGGGGGCISGLPLVRSFFTKGQQGDKTRMMQKHTILKIVLKLQIFQEKYKKKVFYIACRLDGVDCISMDMDMKVTLIGYVDPVKLIAKLRKLCVTQILSVGPVKEDMKVQKRSTFVTLVKQITQKKHTNSVTNDVLLESNSVWKSHPLVTQPFFNRYGRGKVLQIEDHPVIPTATIEEEDDIEQVYIDDESETFKTTHIDEVQDFKDFDRMIDDDDHKSMHLEEGQAHTAVVTKIFPPAIIEVAEDEGVQKLVENATNTNAINRKVVSNIVSFHGHNVPSHLLPSLERLHVMEGDFWTGSVCSGTGVTTDVMTLLSPAIKLLDRPWHTLDMGELELLVSSVAAARAFRFKISRMERIANEAQKILNCKDLMAQYEDLKVELAKVKEELKKRLAGRDMSSTVGSVIDT